MKPTFFTVIFLTVSFFCQSQKIVPIVPCTDSLPAKLYAFVAEKISVTYVPPGNGSWDAEYIGEYRVVENVYGYFPNDTIRFTGFTHMRLSLSNFKHVLLFVGEYCGKLYHEKYQFFDVYKTVEGKWARPDLKKGIVLSPDQ
jgi:hypothetical protein